MEEEEEEEEEVVAVVQLGNLIVVQGAITGKIN